MSSPFQLSEKAVARIAEAAVLTVPGTISLDSKLAGLAGRSLPRIEATINRAASTASVDADIATSYPAPVVAITETVRNSIASHVRSLTGLTVTRVNVTVANARPVTAPGVRVTTDLLEGHPTFVVPSPITVRPLRVVSPTTAPARELAPTTVRQSLTQVHRPSAPEPVPLRPVTVPPAPELREISVADSPRVEVVRRPLAVLRPSAPAPQPVLRPRPPLPVALRPISIKPVVTFRDV